MNSFKCVRPFQIELEFGSVLLVLIVLSVLYDCQKTIKLQSPQSCLNSLPARRMEKALLTV